MIVVCLVLNLFNVLSQYQSIVYERLVIHFEICSCSTSGICDYLIFIINVSFNRELKIRVVCTEKKSHSDNNVHNLPKVNFQFFINCVSVSYRGLEQKA